MSSKMFTALCPADHYVGGAGGSKENEWSVSLYKIYLH